MHRTHRALLTALRRRIVHVVTSVSPSVLISFSCLPGRLGPRRDFRRFVSSSNELFRRRSHCKHSLFNTRLSSFSVGLRSHAAERFTSHKRRGLIILLLGVTRIARLGTGEKSIVFLLSSFVASFSSQHTLRLLPPLVALNKRLVFAYPGLKKALRDRLTDVKTRVVALAS